MVLNNNRISDLKISYIGGGSKEWAWKLMSDLALEIQLSGTVTLYDIDKEAAIENATVGAMHSNHPDSKSGWKYQVANTLEQTLTGADFVIISILPGTFQEMRSDVHAPEKYGIYQSVGDTVGPGGIIRALRTIPLYVDFALNIKKYCPDAWVLNYTNPMAVCTRTLFEVFPQIKAFGCCHEVFHTQSLLALMVKEVLGVEDVTRSDIKTNILGINHFTWINSAFYKNIDLFPLYRDFSEKYYYCGYADDPFETWLSSPFHSAARVRFDLFKRYGLIAAAGDRHLVEFLPPWYLRGPELAKEWKFSLTTVDFRIAQMKDRLNKRKRILTGEEHLKLAPSGEEGIKQIKALLGLDELITNVNIPNAGQLKGIPKGAVVETNAHLSGMGIKPVIAGYLPNEIQNIVIRHVLNQEMVVKAGIEKNKELAYRAFVNDPLVNINLEDSRKLFDEMLRNTREYLQGWEI
jgi:galacturan 1,4-alpha-galacturonidase